MRSSGEEMMKTGNNEMTEGRDDEITGRRR
jgi:hypothetical protein